MDYLDFFDVALYGNTMWKGNFTTREVAQNAYDYKVEYDASMEKFEPTETMRNLCELLAEDIYEGKEIMADFDIQKMLNVLNDAMEMIDNYVF